MDAKSHGAGVHRVVGHKEAQAAAQGPRPWRQGMAVTVVVVVTVVVQRRHGRRQLGWSRS